ncbi:Sure-like protein [Mycena kentingensis (nom. inval.)]|nr:Sure-like protein [Mycena kentingensis (nom. inval.)]
MRILLTNDDGPPSPASSPYIFQFYDLLCRKHDVKVVIPSTQKSWIGKAFHITEVTKGHYFYPKASNPFEGEVSPSSRPLKEDERAEWILLDGTPSTCVNVSLHNLYPGQIDLVISGPNFGRNSSALDGALAKTRSIALSCGTVLHPTPDSLIPPAHALAYRIVEELLTNWGRDDGGLRSGEVDLYSVNIPLIPDLLAEQSLKVMWTSMWRNHYGRLFKPVSSPSENVQSDAASTLAFKFSPAMDGLLQPDESLVPEGSDGWALLKGMASVTPLRASFAEPPQREQLSAQERIWKMKL